MAAPRPASERPTNNPYLSPSPAALEELPDYGPLRPGARAELLEQRLLYRKIQVSSPLEMIVEFNGRGLTDRLLIDGQVVDRHTSWYRITPRLQAWLRAGDQLASVGLSLRVYPWLSFRRFRLEIAGQRVYEE